MRHLTSLAGALLLFASGAAQAQTATTATAATTTLTTAGLAELCGAEGVAALGYCRGFLVGAGQYHGEISSPGGRPAIFCLPDPAPAVETAQASFIAWAKANPQHAGDKAINGLLRWAQATYPCPKPTARTRATSR